MTPLGDEVYIHFERAHHLRFSFTSSTPSVYIHFPHPSTPCIHLSTPCVHLLPAPHPLPSAPLALPLLTELPVLTTLSQADGVILVKTTQAILVTEYQAPIQAGESVPTVEGLADYLIGVGY